jgi:hypothetical protein
MLTLMQDEEKIKLKGEVHLSFSIHPAPSLSFLSPVDETPLSFRTPSTIPQV